MTSHHTPQEPIAIVGTACRFAGGVDSPSKLWNLLREPRDVRSEIPRDRFDVKGFYHPNSSQHGHANVRHSYMFDHDPTYFDAEFFGINPIESRAMDPQQRVLLETVYEALESSGMSIEKLRGSDTSVYAGVMCGDYEAVLLRDLDVAPTYWAVGTSRAVLSNRISYFFDWHGASVTVDTACSSSLVAVHQAIQALRAGDTHMAVACGSNLILGPEMYIIESKVKMLSPDGLSRMWDKDANGYARGEGVGAIVLKTLSAALADGDDIECIIRETGLNQDGATTGLTMPSAEAQRALIHRTYKKAGLDLKVAADRPQYFEAHGTGTPAGDPVEAEAICRAFFPDDQSSQGQSKLYVGSIKTVLGHTEGTAGIAALLKASLALQNSSVPPNLHFNSINPSVLPFYDNLEILKKTERWPTVAGGQPQRASVNSFGFGGTNAHAILESYAKPPADLESTNPNTLFTPFVFSAASEDSLRALLSAYAAYLHDQPQTSIHDLAYTLRERRSVFPYRASFSAQTIDALRTELVKCLDDTSSPIATRKLAKAAGARSRLLGIFTGQGAQYARMGAELIQTSPLARGVVRSLDEHLSQLPDAPTWSLEGELLASEDLSRVGQAAISQPLCTAVQIMLVQVLRTAGVEFDAVVGHSSGEIAAAYSAGFLTARDAIYAAYYRGLHCRHAASPNGAEIRGAMMAVGTSVDDATELCQSEEFAGRLGLAASNSSSSVTISGDEDAIEELQIILEDEKKFARRLRVDQAYHSKHMIPCSAPYVESLHRAGVRGQKPSSAVNTVWFSSVYDGRPVTAELSDAISGTYWAENMTKTVLFSQALAAALAGPEGFDAVVEVGPHSALKGPASQTIQEIMQKSIPYQGVLRRGEDSVDAVVSCLGFLWRHVEAASLRLNDSERAMAADTKPRQFNVLKGLPSYQWNHQTSHWFESRRSRRMRLRSQPFHPLLGDESPDSSAHTMRWKNVLKPSEIPWVEGHQVQGQVVFPAAGYVATAIEGARYLASDGAGNPVTVRLIELSDFHIQQAVMFDGDGSGVEVLIEFSNIFRDASKGYATATFTYSAAVGGDSADLVLAARGDLKVFLGDEASPDLLPRRQPAPPHMISLDESRLYTFMEGLEYNFSGCFRSLVQLRRKLGRASCVAKRAVTEDMDHLLVHPADLDAAFQSVMLAYSYPGDGQLRLLHLPTSIAKIRVNPAAIAGIASGSGFTSVDSSCNREDRLEPGSGFSGNVSLYYTDDIPNAAVQVDRVKFKPVGTTASDDRNLFYKMNFVPIKPDGDLAAAEIPVTQYDKDLLWVLSRIAAYFLREFDDSIAEDAPVRKESPLCHYLNYARHMTNLIRKDEHKWAKKEWLNDTLEDVMNEINEKGVADNSDVRIMLLVGHTMPKVFKGETTMLEHFRESGLLDLYYAQGFGTMQSTLWLSQAVKQITDYQPHLSLLEIGAGTGGATRNILQAIGSDFDKYTFTDISSSFFENAADLLAPWGDRMVFSVCDAEKDPAQQGFKEGSYDVIIAYMVIHATAKLDESLRNLRKMLKPGGYLIVGEGASDGPLQAGAGFIFGTLSGWWRGVDEGRTLSPLINVGDWERLLLRTGFSGIDAMSPPHLLDTFGISLFVSQAVDANVQTIRQPLEQANSQAVPRLKKLLILGGQTAAISSIAEGIRTVLTPFAEETILCKRLEDINTLVDSETAVLSLLDLESPVFKDMTPARWTKFRGLFTENSIVVWLTEGRLADEPYCNMTVGFGRSAVHEEEGLRLQFIDVANVADIDAQQLAERFLRFVFVSHQADDLHIPEPEIIVDHQGRDLVPRLTAISAANNRLNSIQRPISHSVSMDDSVVELQFDAAHGLMLRDLSRYELGVQVSDDIVELKTTHAVVSAIKSRFGNHFLAVATDSEGNRFVTMVPALKSMLHVPKAAAVNCEQILASQSEEALLTQLASQLIAAAIVEPLYLEQRLLVHNAPEVVAQAVANYALARGVNLVLTAEGAGTEYSESQVPNKVVKLVPFMERAELSLTLGLDQVDSFVSFSDSDSDTVRTILSALPTHCGKETPNTLYSHRSLTHLSSLCKALGGELEKAISVISSRPYQAKVEPTVVSLQGLASGEFPTQPLTIVNDWTPQSPVSARIMRFDTKKLFKADKTYWLCGLSGALGISLCDWMIEMGARNLVLTSRNPKIDPIWVEDHARKGVTVRIISCDVTDENALRRVHRTIVETMPPIIGALNAAMVLRDVSIRNMEFDQVQDVTRPKVLGSIHLDRIFQDVNLDFFVLISSINCVIGNVGQANYAAANMGMCSVAANRRKRGLRSSVVNVGAIIGVGYITQSARQLDVTVAKTAMMHLSEEDFHQIFAEAMEAGHLDSDMGPEISTGLLEISPDESENIPKWYSDPKFARFIVHKTANQDDGKKDQGDKVSVQDRLHACKTSQEVLQVIQQAFGAQLRKILQSSLPDEELMMMRSVDLGLDSLISVDIRSWFAKNLRVSIPVLKIMASDAQMSTLTELAASTIPADLIPLISKSEDGTGASEVVTGSSEGSADTNTSAASSSAGDTTPTENTSAGASDKGDNPSKVDWKAETCPANGTLVPTDGPPPHPIPRTILLTGCSGLLGHHLLDALLAQPTTEKVICIAVRKLAERLQAKELPAPSDRIVYYEGDLTQPLLGLTPTEATRIFGEIDAVVHNGSDTSHLKYYSTLREANVGSTKQLVQLCLPRKIPLHYVSSAGVALFIDDDAFGEVSCTTTGKEPPSDGSHGYMCGKWVCESMLERVKATNPDLRIVIQRPSTIIREGDDAAVARAEFDWVNALLHYSHRIRAVPHVEHNAGFFDLVRVQTVCDDIIRELLRPVDGSAAITYVNNVGDTVISMVQMNRIGLQRPTGEQSLYETLPMEEWAKKAIEAGLHPAVAALIETFDEPGAAKYPRLMRSDKS